MHLDGLLFDLKYDPSVIEMPVPRYFKEEDTLPIEIPVFKEDVYMVSGGKKKKKKGGKKPKKGKKKKEEEKEEKKVIGMEEKETKIDNILKEFFKTDEPVEEIVQDPFSFEMGFILAIRWI